MTDGNIHYGLWMRRDMDAPVSEVDVDVDSVVLDESMPMMVKLGLMLPESPNTSCVHWRVSAWAEHVKTIRTVDDVVVARGYGWDYERHLAITQQEVRRERVVCMLCQ